MKNKISNIIVASMLTLGLSPVFAEGEDKAVKKVSESIEKTSEVVKSVQETLNSVGTNSHALDEASQALDTAKGVVNEVAGVVNTTDFNSKPKYYISYNFIASQMNASIDNSTVPTYDDSAYHLEASIVWKSTKAHPLGTKNAMKYYYAFHALKRTNTGYDDSYWSQKTTSLYVAYGEKYYLTQGYQGLGFGWYGGVGLSSGTDGYYWYSEGSTASTYIPEDELELIIAGELFYQYEYKNFYVAPRVIGGIDKKTGAFSFWPQFMMGATF